MNDAAENELETLLAEGVHAARARQRVAYERAAGTATCAIVLAGSGALGRFALAGLRAAGVGPVAFVDNASSRWGSQIEGVPVLSPADACARYGRDAVFVVTVYNASGLHRQLRELGCDRVVAYPAVFARYAEHLLPHVCLADPAGIFDAADAVRAGLRAFAAPESRSKYVAQVRARLLLDFDPPRPRESLQPEYFPSDVYASDAREVFVDCGAFDGDTLRRFLAARGEQFDRAVVIEPDPGNATRLRSYVATLPPTVRERVRVVQSAVGRANGWVGFAAQGSVCSGVAPGAATQVPCIALDALDEPRAPTLIKMDVEGHELEALEGARRTIVDNAPVLAVNVYHRQDDLWRIPLAIRAMRDDYALHLLAHAEACWDVCCYAVPPGRGPHAG